MSFCPSSPNRGPRRTLSDPLQKKERVREKLERSQPWRLMDHRRNSSSDETRTRIKRLARPTLRQDPRTFREVRFWTTFLRSEFSLCESILKCWNIHLGTTHAQSVKKFGRDLNPKAGIRESSENSERTFDSLNSSDSQAKNYKTNTRT